MDEYNQEGLDYEEEGEEGYFEGAEEEVFDDQTEQQRAEAADLAKLFRQHPEIWIPYEEQVFEKLTIVSPGENSSSTEGETNLFVGLRDASTLDANHTTYPFLTNYERTKIISYRASQISNGAHPYIAVPDRVSDAYEIAKLELDAKRLPFILKRPLPDGSFEVWKLADLLVF